MFSIKTETQMMEVVARLADYISSYDQHYEFGKYNARVYIDDILYGVGISIDDEKYRYKTGFDLFKRDLAIYYGEADSFKTINTLLDKIEELELKVTEMENEDE